MSVSSERNWKISMQARVHAHMCVHKNFWTDAPTFVSVASREVRLVFWPSWRPLHQNPLDSVQFALHAVCKVLIEKKILTSRNSSSLGSSLFFGYKIKRHFSIKFEKLPLQLNNKKKYIEFRSFHSLVSQIITKYLLYARHNAPILEYMASHSDMILQFWNPGLQWAYGLLFPFWASTLSSKGWY